MTDREKKLNEIKTELDSRFSGLYETTDIDGDTFFVNHAGVPFRVCWLLADDWHALTIEYGDTWEDGNSYNPDALGVDEIFEAMLDEIES